MYLPYSSQQIDTIYALELQKVFMFPLVTDKEHKWVDKVQ